MICYDMITIYIMQCRFDTMVLSRKFLVLIQIWSRWNGIMEWPCTQTNPLWMGAHGCDWVSAVVRCFCRRSKLQHFLARYQRFRIHFMEILFFVTQDLSIFVAALFQDVWTQVCYLSFWMYVLYISLPHLLWFSCEFPLHAEFFIINKDPLDLRCGPVTLKTPCTLDSALFQSDFSVVSARPYWLERRFRENAFWVFHSHLVLQFQA